MDRVVTIPAGFLEDPLWSAPAWAAAYINLQLRADSNGEVIYSERLAAEWWKMSRHSVRQCVAVLAARGLVRFLEATPTRPHRMQMTPFWGMDINAHSCTPIRIDEPVAQPSKPAETQPSEKPTATTTPVPIKRTRQPSKKAKPQPRAEAIELEGFEAPPADPKRENDVQRLTRLLHVMGLHEAPHFTGKVWAKQAQVIARMLEANEAAAVEAAIRGIRLLFPFCDKPDQVYDAFVVERLFAKAASAHFAAKRVSDGGIAARLEAQRLAGNDREQREAEHRAATQTWRDRMTAAYLELDENDQGVVDAEVERRVQKIPMSEAGKDRMRPALQNTVMGERLNDPPPPSLK